MNRDDLIKLLSLTDENQIEELFKKAYQIKQEFVGTKVYYRGIIEFSNYCVKDCYYCGIRKSNSSVDRFMMTKEEILEAAKWAYDEKFGSLVLQSGERIDREYIDFVTDIIKEIKKIGDGSLGITLSLGEQTEESYKKWFEAGAHRYLLRIETSNRELYQKLHPESHLFDERLNCLKTLKKLGFQTGTGVMIGLPEQTIEDLANDLIFFKEMDIDMIGMGPYVLHQETPLAKKVNRFDSRKQLLMGLKMIAVARVFLKDVNVASTTALQALDPLGREKGLQAGANIIMPNIGAVTYRKAYQLYDNKPCLDESAGICKTCFEGRVEVIGESVGYGEWGDSPHFKNRDKTKN